VSTAAVHGNFIDDARKHADHQRRSAWSLIASTIATVRRRRSLVGIHARLDMSVDRQADPPEATEGERTNERRRRCDVRAAEAAVGISRSRHVSLAHLITTIQPTRRRFSACGIVSV